MAYRKIDTRIWNDEKFRTLSNEGKYFFIYLLTCPHSTAWGAYVLDDLYVQADLGYSLQKIKQLWNELANSKLTIRDTKTRLVCFPNWFKYNPPANEKTAIACIRGIMTLPKSEILSRYCEQSEWVRDKLANLNLTVSEQLDDEHLALSTEYEQEYEHEQPPPKKIVDSGKPQKKKYLDTVFLTDDQYEKLKTAMGDDLLQKGIEKLDYSLSNKPGKYKDHYKTLLHWHKQGWLTGNNGDQASSRPYLPPIDEDHIWDEEIKKRKKDGTL